ncbi:hypothetical protein DKX38_007143 [Salix brachista]|uniref:Nuclear cap-binding protein subunit 2 n=1 Tax=Salix brachista TaxID=2182728 RepID=A0A5N5MMC7_9ROSI|nr:hypothetical protein DKX38_007143 [Salix brachista]
MSFYTTKEQVYELFTRAGEIKKIIMGLDKNSKTLCGFCFILKEGNGVVVEMVDRCEMNIGQTMILISFSFVFVCTAISLSVFFPNLLEPLWICATAKEWKSTQFPLFQPIQLIPGKLRRQIEKVCKMHSVCFHSAPCILCSFGKHQTTVLPVRLGGVLRKFRRTTDTSRYKTFHHWTERGIRKLMETNRDAIEASFALEVPVIFCEHLSGFSSFCRG